MLKLILIPTNYANLISEFFYCCNSLPLRHQRRRPRLHAERVLAGRSMRLADLRIPKSVVMDLILRHLHMDGISSLDGHQPDAQIAIPILDGFFRELRQQHLVEVKGAVGEDYALR